MVLHTTHPRFTALGVLLAAVCPALRAQVAVSPTVTQSAGSYTYTYQVSNTGLSAVTEFAVFVDGPVTQYGTPTDWTLNATDEGGVVYADWLSDLTGIAAGAALSGFQLVSPNPPGDVFYTAFSEDGGYFTGETSGPTLPVVYGDVNADGVVDAGDVVAALQASGGLSASANVNNGDVAPKPSAQAGGFGDGQITVADALRILRRIHGLEPTWP